MRKNCTKSVEILPSWHFWGGGGTQSYGQTIFWTSGRFWWLERNSQNPSPDSAKFTTKLPEFVSHIIISELQFVCWGWSPRKEQIKLRNKINLTVWTCFQSEDHKHFLWNPTQMTHHVWCDRQQDQRSTVLTPFASEIHSREDVSFGCVSCRLRSWTPSWWSRDMPLFSRRIWGFMLGEERILWCFSCCFMSGLHLWCLVHGLERNRKLGWRFGYF